MFDTIYDPKSLSIEEIFRGNYTPEQRDKLLRAKLNPVNYPAPTKSSIAIMRGHVLPENRKDNE